MTNKNHRRGQRRRSRMIMAPWLAAGTALLLLMAMGAARRPACETVIIRPEGTRQEIPVCSGSTPPPGCIRPEGTRQEIRTLERDEAPCTDDWRLLLVNSNNPVPDGYSIETVELRNGFEVDERCYPDLQEMMDACREAGLEPLICSAYRTQEYQEMLYRKQIEKQLALGCSPDAAETEAAKYVAVPGTSEHQLGLAVDIVDMSYQLLDDSQEDTAAQRWLTEHSWEYGFILRYPEGKSDITGIAYEPWHYRYVGRENAEQIHRAGLCLEEYLGCA